MSESNAPTPAAGGGGNPETRHAPVQPPRDTSDGSTNVGVQPPRDTSTGGSTNVDNNDDERKGISLQS